MLILDRKKSHSFQGCFPFCDDSRDLLGFCRHNRHMTLTVLESHCWELAVLLHTIMKNEYFNTEIIMED